MASGHRTRRRGKTLQLLRRVRSPDGTENIDLAFTPLEPRLSRLEPCLSVSKLVSMLEAGSSMLGELPFLTVTDQAPMLVSSFYQTQYKQLTFFKICDMMF